MRFPRFGDYKQSIWILAAICSFFALVWIITSERSVWYFIFIIIFFLLLLLLYLLDVWLVIPKLYHGSVRDYIVISEDLICLFTKGDTVCIKCDEVFDFRRRPIGNRFGFSGYIAEIRDCFGKKITFSTTDRQDKAIFAICPVLKYHYHTVS